MAILLALPACAGLSDSAATHTIQELPTRFASSLEATKAVYVAFCLPTPAANQVEVCAAAKKQINDVIESYNVINAELPE